jgi:hypothetical protein
LRLCSSSQFHKQSLALLGLQNWKNRNAQEVIITGYGVKANPCIGLAETVDDLVLVAGTKINYKTNGYG